MTRPLDNASVGGPIGGTQLGARQWRDAANGLREIAAEWDAKAERDTEDVVTVLKCERQHITLWPVALLPYPAICPCADGADHRCQTALRDLGTHFRREPTNG